MATTRPAKEDSTQLTFTGGFIIGVALVVLGIGAWVLSDFASMTALIPVLFGILAVGFASLGRETDRVRLAVYGIGALGAFAIVGSLRAVADLFALATSGDVNNVIPVASQGIMLPLGLALLVIAVRAVLLDR